MFLVYLEVEIFPLTFLIRGPDEGAELLEDLHFQALTHMGRMLVIFFLEYHIYFG
jgi:hypothetical protein